MASPLASLKTFHLKKKKKPKTQSLIKVATRETSVQVEVTSPLLEQQKLLYWKTEWAAWVMTTGLDTIFTKGCINSKNDDVVKNLLFFPSKSPWWICRAEQDKKAAKGFQTKITGATAEDRSSPSNNWNCSIPKDSAKCVRPVTWKLPFPLEQLRQSWTDLLIRRNSSAQRWRVFSQTSFL